MKLALLSTISVAPLVHSTSFKSDFLLETLSKRSKNNPTPLKNYGCYCFKDDQDFFSGKGPGVNKLDKLCKALTNCYKCNAHSFGTCDPVLYQNDVKMTKDGHFDCPNENSDFAEDQCNSGFCQCDIEFLKGVEQLDLEGLEKEFGDDELDRVSQCVMNKPSIKETAAKEIERDMPSNPSKSEVSAPMRAPPGLASLGLLEQPSFKFGVGAPTFNTNDNNSPISNSGRGTNNIISALGRPLATNSLLSNIDLDSVKNNLADVPDEDASDQGENNEAEYLYEDVGLENSEESISQQITSDSEMSISSLPAFAGSRPSFQNGASSVGRLGIGFASGNARNFIIVPSDSVSECCGDSPNWFPITFSEHKSCCEDKSYNVLLSQCCDGKILATGSC